MDFRNIYEKFESKLLKNTPDLSITEYKILFSINNNSKGRINNSIIIKLIKGLQNKSLDPNKLLDIIIDGINTDEHLLLFSLLLRNGANVNKYILYENVNIHILAYIHIKYNNNLIMLNTILTLLLFSDSDPKSKLLKDGDLSVLEWLDQQKFSSIISLSKETLLDNLDLKFSTKIATLLNNPLLIKTTDNINLIEVIRDDSDEIFMLLIPKINELNENGKIIDLCIKYFNEHIFNICMNYGIQLRYYQINLLVIQIKHTESLIIKKIIKSIFDDYINHGGYIDKYQESIINKDIIKNINENIIINNLLKSDYKENNILLYIKKSYIEHGSTYSSDQRLDTAKKGYDFLDIFKSNDVIATPDMFEDMLSNDTNFIEPLQTQRTLCKRLGYIINKSQSKIKENPINDLKFYNIEQALCNLIKLNINQDINNLSIIKMENILNNIEGNEIPLLNLLTVEHYRRTFLITCHEKAINGLDKLLSIFSE